jgi:D-beta-D-heptose 7-phosphate kinase/D-beta-D-heptose 1-phosphate adenosyltransferase
MTSSHSETIAAFTRQRILVIGDSILDHYVIGDVRRTSPEAPVVVLNVQKDEYLPGGAANVARNIASQGARVVFASICGDDEAGVRLRGLIARDPLIELDFQIDPTRPTSLKTRCVAQGQQMLRLDREDPGAPPAAVEKRLVASIKRHIRSVDGIVLSDYAKGTLTPGVLEAVRSLAEKHGREVIVDPKGSDYSRYRGMTLITPNKKEAQEATGLALDSDASIREAARVLQNTIKGKAICITLSAGGVGMFPQRGEPAFLPASAREVYDVTGAGDTFISVLALARFAGAGFVQAAELGNLAAGIVVGRAGVATVSREELLREVAGDVSLRKHVSVRELVEVRRSLARSGRRVVFTNGCFDLINVRHIRLLEQARALGHVLVVALNSDDSVRRLKGEPRPLLSARERVELLSALNYVDYVTVFEGDTPEELLELLRPDVLVKGTNVESVVGREIVERTGGRVVLLDLDFAPGEEDAIASGGRKPRAKSKRPNPGRTSK